MGHAVMKKLLFLATEDWFVRSHFLPLVRRAQAEGYEVLIGARDSGALTESGARVVAMPFARGSFNPLSIAGEARAVGDLLRAEKPDIVHAIALKPIVLSLLAGAQGTARVFAVTGRGYLATSRASWLAALIASRLRAALDDQRSALLVENNADRAWAEGKRPLPDARVALMPGAGVDPERFTPAPMPDAPITIGLAARLVRSKGVDLAIEAVRRMNAEGQGIRLRIAGETDGDNPRGVGLPTIARWHVTPGVKMLGRVDDIPGFWADAHIACLPSRGGEGLPRTLLEAAACGRPIVTTDTPGCADFVRHGHDGLVVPPDDVDALIEALRTLARGSALREAMGVSARARVLTGYTETHAADVAAGVWRRLV